jgi:N-acetylglucosaminyl-diphospho-decaprenol L-rhamnosyltransferase
LCCAGSLTSPAPSERIRAIAAEGEPARDRRRPGGLCLFVSYSGLLGGGERILLDLAPRLARAVAVACPEGALAGGLRQAGVRVFPLSERRLEFRASVRDRVGTPLRIASHAREVGDLIAALRPEIVVGWGTRALLGAVTAVRRIDPPPSLVFQNNDPLQGPLIGLVARAAARRADLIVALSRAAAGDFDPRGELEDRTVVVSPGVDLESYARIPAADVRPHALLLGAIVRWKRPRLALESVALARRELPELRLTVAGAAIDASGERLIRALRRRAAEPDLAGAVTFAGLLHDPRPALAEATCLLHAADREPYGMVVVEALAAGRAVVAPAAAGPAEIVTPDTGRLYAPGDPSSAAEALVELHRTPELPARVGAAARARAQTNYRVEESSARYETLLDELAARRRRSFLAPPAAQRARGAGIAIVTVLHDSEREVRRLLASIGRHLPDARVVAVDSGSSDGGAAAVRAWRHDARALELGRNVGFGAACNAALAEVREPVTVLLNPDAELLDGSLIELAEEILRHDRPERIVAPLVVRPDGMREKSAHPEPGTQPELLRAIVPAARLPRPLREWIEPWRADAPRRVGWAAGACLVARTDTLRRLGPFDERDFLYAEDLDLGLRAIDTGVETWFWPSARVLHHRAHASSRVFGGEPFDLLATRRREVVRRRRGVGRQHADDGLQLMTFATRIALKTLLRRSAHRERRQVAALMRARREDR